MRMDKSLKGVVWSQAKLLHDIACAHRFGHTRGNECC
jgi:hypothetical protein